MNFKIKTETLIEYINLVARALPNKSPRPLSESIKFSVKKDSIKIFANHKNLEIMAIVDTNIEVLTEGNAILDGKTILNIIKSPGIALHEEVQFIQISEYQVLIIAGTSEFRLNALNYDLEHLIFEEDEKPIVISSEDLAISLKEVVYCTADPDAKPRIVCLTGVNFAFSERRLTLTASDNARLAQKRLEVNSKKNLNLTIPAESIKELLKILEQTKGDVEISVNPLCSKVLFVIKNVFFQTAVLSDKYGNLNSATQFETKLSIPLKTVEFSNALKTISAVTDKTKSTYLINFTLKPNKTCEVATSENGKGSSRAILIPAGEIYNQLAETFLMIFSLKHLQEAISVYESLGIEELALEFYSNDRAVRITSLEEPELVTLITPLNNF